MIAKHEHLQYNTFSKKKYPASAPVPGGQYAIGQAPGRSEVTVSSLRCRLILNCQGQLFCFDLFFPP